MTIKALTVADCMVPARLTLTPETTIQQAVEKMINHDVIGAPVVDEQQHVLGFVSEQDCLRHMISDTYYHDERLMVKDIMNPDVLFAEANMSVLDLAQMMSGNKPKKYPVCENGKLIGVIHRTHVVKALLDSMKQRTVM